MLHEQITDGRKFSIFWCGPGHYGAQQHQHGENWTYAVLDSDDVPEWKVGEYGRHLGTLRYFSSVEEWLALPPEAT